MQYVVVNRNKNGACLAVMGPYPDEATATYVCNLHSGIKRGWRTEPLVDQFTQQSDYYVALKRR